MNIDNSSSYNHLLGIIADIPDDFFEKLAWNLINELDEKLEIDTIINKRIIKMIIWFTLNYPDKLITFLKNLNMSLDDFIKCYEKSIKETQYYAFWPLNNCNLRILWQEYIIDLLKSLKYNEITSRVEDSNSKIDGII